MRISRSKIESYMFTVKKGKYYDSAEVDAALDEIAGDVDELQSELFAQRERIRELEKRDESVAQALIIVKQLSQKIVDEAKAQAQKLITQRTEQASELEQEITRLQEFREQYKIQLESEIKKLTFSMLSELGNVPQQMQQRSCGIGRN